MFLGGNPVDGFVVLPKAKGRSLGIAANLNPSAFSTAAQTAPAPAAPQTVAQAASAAIQAGLAPPSAVPGAQGLISPADLNSTNGACSNDGTLVWLNGAWHVSSVDDVTCTSQLVETAQQIIKTWVGYPTYVGPFPVDFVKNPNGQITNLSSPTQVGSTWGAWLALQDMKVMQAALSAAAVAGHAVNVYPFVQALPLVVGQTQWLLADGTPVDPSQVSAQQQLAAGTDGATILSEIQTAIQQLTGAVASTLPPNTPASTTPALTTPATTSPGNIIQQFGPFPYPGGVPAQSASGGHALYPSKAWTQPDSGGFLQTFVQYENDPYTYSYYSYQSWLDALSALYGQIGLGLPPQSLTPAMLSNFDSMKNGPLPIAKFKNPITGANWGLWVTLPSVTGFADEGQWNTSTDAPNGASSFLQIAVAPIPQETFWDQVMDVVDWIPTELGAALFTIAGWMSAFVCGLARQQAMLNTIPKNNPAAMTAALAALAIANAAQCGPQPVNCDPALCDNNPACPHLVSPQCQTGLAVTAVATPWYQQWWVIAAGIGLVAYLLLSKSEEPKGA
jgi:hypothetical protein